ncbi:PQQ-binding-like beta-propeller repeat protein [Halobaculum sp. MBLA0147]|uniref:outer membrane protein assembly factor BamB family protein n=1 Tax=Halobaculum sp. MBLA0147 TaxID=3079934 RepID=UPI003526A8C7
MPSDDDTTDGWRRRRLLGVGAAGAALGLAGCTDSLGDTDTGTAANQPSPSGSTVAPTSESDGSPSASLPSSLALRGPWPTPRADPANTGRVDAPGPRGTPSVRWRSAISLQTDTLAAVGPDGPVATRQDGLVVALDHDGAVRWRRRVVPETYAASVVASDGTVVTAGLDGRVVAHDRDGTERWHVSTPESLYPPHAGDATPLAVAGDDVLVAHPQGRVFAFGLADGTRRWETDVPRSPHRPAVVDGRAVLVCEGTDGRDEPTLLSLALADGRREWARTVPGPISVGPGTDGERVYTGSIHGRVAAHALVDGADLWAERLPERAWVSTIPTPFAGRVWVGTLDEGLFAVDADSVQARVGVESPLTPATDDELLYTAVTATGGTPVAGSGTVVAVDGSGDVRWRRRTTGFPNGHVHLDGDGVVVGTDAGVTTALAATDGEPRWRAVERPRRLPTPVVGPRALYVGDRSDHVSGMTLDRGLQHLWGTRFDGTPTDPVSTTVGVVAGGRDGGLAATPPSEVFEAPGRLTITPTPEPDATPEPHVDYPSPDPLWRRALDEPVHTVAAAPTHGPDDAGRLYLGTDSGVVAASPGGEVQWRQTLEGAVARPPAVDETGLYATTTAGRTVALDTTGTVRWRTAVGERPTTPALATGVGQVLVGSADGVVALATADGSQVWEGTDAPVVAAPAVARGEADGGESDEGELAVVADRPGSIEGLRLPAGTTEWRVDAGAPVHGSPAVADGVAYLGTRGGELLAVRVGDGTVQWRLSLGDWVDGAPVVGHGAVFVVDQSGSVSAVVGEK